MFSSCLKFSIEKYTGKSVRVSDMKFKIKKEVLQIHTNGKINNTYILYIIEILLLNGYFWSLQLNKH